MLGLYTDIIHCIQNISIHAISEERKAKLLQLSAYVSHKKAANERIQLNFICTHNSRRSILCQVWAQAIAWYCDIEIDTYSGGTEKTAVYPQIYDTLRTHGFLVDTLLEENDTISAIRYANDRKPIVGFSKTYKHFYNPSEDFAAILVCDQADAECPIVFGCDERIALPYTDPKLSDGTSEKDRVYKERSLQIATEMMYVFKNVSRI